MASNLKMESDGSITWSCNSKECWVLSSKRVRTWSWTRCGHVPNLGKVVSLEMGNRKGVDPEHPWSLFLLTLQAGLDLRWVTSAVVWSRATVIKCPSTKTADSCATHSCPVSVNEHVRGHSFQLSQHFTRSHSSCSVWTPLEESPLRPSVWTKKSLSYMWQAQTPFMGILTWTLTIASSLSQGFPFFLQPIPVATSFFSQLCMFALHSYLMNTF